MADRHKKVTAHSFGRASSVSARGLDNVPNNVTPLTPGLLGKSITQIRRQLDAQQAPIASWINVIDDRPDLSRQLTERQRLFEDQGLWGI